VVETERLTKSYGSARGIENVSESVAIRARLGNLPGDFGYGKGASGREALSLLARLRGMRASAKRLLWQER
jgi:ABC-type multidrug transport system ATPase subunit